MRSGTEALAAARPTGIEDLATARARHPGSEAMTALAHQLARLIGPLHGFLADQARLLPGSTPGETRINNSAAEGRIMLRRLIREGPSSVNAAEGACRSPLPIREWHRSRLREKMLNKDVKSR